MKSTVKYFTVLMLTATVITGCREESLMTEGEGTLHLETTVNSKVDVVSRALSAEQEQALAETAVISIYKKNGGVQNISKSNLLYQYVGASNVPASLRLMSGYYSAEAWAGDSVPASWNKTFYRTDFVDFGIVSGENTDITLNCKVRNTLASVSYTQSALEMLSSPVMTISLDDGVTDGSHSLVFDETNSGAKGHFMINSRTKGLIWTLTGTETDGSEFTKSGKIENIKHATEYRLKVDFSGSDLTIGGAYFDIQIEEEPIGEETNVELRFPPTITGMLGFDIDNRFSGEEGKIDRKSVFISAASDIDEVNLTSDFLKDIIGNESVELMFLTGRDTEQTLFNAGINWNYFSDNKTGMSGLRINFEEEFTNTLPEGSHTFEIAAKDKDGKSSNATFVILVTNAPVSLNPVNQSNISYNTARLEGTVLKEANEYGFEIREATVSRAYETWTRVKAVVSGNTIYADVTNLEAGKNYEYRVYADDFVSEETQSLITPAYPQFPNAGFEEWQTSSSPYLIYSSGGELFWDSGNHGSATMKKNVTVPDESIKHSGSNSIKLASQFVGVGSLGKFAAGNLFIGQYLATDGTDGVLGWGRPWDARPKALKLWVKYSPVTVDYDSSDYSDLKKGDMDNGKIYIALLTDDKVTATDSKGNKYGDWPVVVRTKSSQRSLFSKDDANVIGYGEMVFTEATGNDMIQVTIPIDYRSDAPVKNIMMVAAASMGGDYFTGGNGSTMWLDDLELVY